MTHHEVGMPGLKGILSFSVPDQRSGKVCYYISLSSFSFSSCYFKDGMCKKCRYEHVNDANIALTFGRFLFIHLIIVP